MYQSNQADPMLMAAYVAMELLKPVFVVLFICGILWIIARFLVELCAVDGGRGRREQRQRHRLQLMVLGVAIACGVTGIVMTQNGYGEGSINVELPGGLKMQNGGMAVVFTSAMLFVLWLLVRTLIETKEGEEQAGKGEAAGRHSNAGREGNPRDQASKLFRNMTYPKAIGITALLLPFLGPIALLPGGFLAFKAWQRNASSASMLLPPPKQE